MFRLLDLWLPLLAGAAAGAHQWQRGRETAAVEVVITPPVLAPVPESLATRG